MFCQSSKAWWVDSFNHLSSFSATTNLVSNTAQTLTTTTQTIAKKVSTIEQTTTQVRSQQLADSQGMYQTLISVKDQVENVIPDQIKALPQSASAKPASHFPSSQADHQQLRSLQKEIP